MSAVKDIENKILHYYGLFSDGRQLYHKKYDPYIREYGLWQQPEEISSLIYFLYEKNINTFLNIGTFNGSTFHCITNLLTTIQSSISIDPIEHKKIYTNTKSLYIKTTSDFLKNISFDLVFIDGDHSYETTKNDFENVGKFAKYCVFHDIDDNFIFQDLNGGCVKFWNEIKNQYNYIEIISHSKPNKNMGIGILILQ